MVLPARNAVYSLTVRTAKRVTTLEDRAVCGLLDDPRCGYSRTSTARSQAKCVDKDSHDTATRKLPVVNSSFTKPVDSGDVAA